LVGVSLLLYFMGSLREVDIMKKIDETDKKIISILQKNARIPLKELAKQVFLSSPSVSARLDKLETEGVITGYHARVNPLMLNYPIKAFVNLELEPDQKPEFYSYIEQIPNVVECNCVTGDYSMLVEVFFESTDELDHFINQLQRFGKTKTQIVFSTYVQHREVPVYIEKEEEKEEDSEQSK
jgi:Lrp/AsnC family transcriptional regulator, leucine-responsive regulatory protein